MSRLIDADKIPWTDLADGRAPSPVLVTFADKVNKMPTIEPQRTGRWIDHVEDGYVECPFCHSATNCDDNISELHFCFSCGARMDGE